MSYIEILILRRLRSGPGHGYELRKRVEQTTGFVLHNNSLYPALRRFEEAGAVTKTAEPQEGRPPRLVYTLTEVGHELLHDMLAEFPSEQAADESEFLARLGQFSLLSFSERSTVLAARTRAVRDRLAHHQTMQDLATPGARFDLPGLILLGTGLTGLLLGAGQGASSGWASAATWQRIAGSFGIGLVAALYATQARAHGPVPALHLTGIVLALTAVAGTVATLALPAVPNTALSRG